MDISLSRRQCLLVWFSLTQRKALEGEMREGWWQFANWKKSLKFNRRFKPSFPFSFAQDSISVKTVTAWRELQCSTACIWQAEFDTQFGRVSVCQIPQVRHLLSNTAAHRGNWLSFLDLGRSLCICVLILSVNVTRYWANLLNAWLIPCCQVSFPPQFRKCLLGCNPNSKLLQKWSWYRSSVLGKQPRTTLFYVTALASKLLINMVFG